jgi:hypothetical protein
MESSRDPSSNVHVSLVLDATDEDSRRTGASLDGDATKSEGMRAAPVAVRLALSSELTELRAYNLARPSKLSSAENRRASNRAEALKSCNVLLLSRAPLVALVDAGIPSLIVVTPLAAPEMVLPLLSRDRTDVPLLKRDSF